MTIWRYDWSACRRATRQAAQRRCGLAKVLPRYMVPTAYIPVNHVPTLISGKTDRKRLRQFGATVDLRQLDQGEEEAAARQLTDLEQRLRVAWSLVLKLNADSIRIEDNFFALGGDSLAAMKLVSVCRERGLALSVINTFNHPTLSAMAGVVLICDVQAQIQTPEFSMISQPVESACIEASQACGRLAADVEDIYPCTPTQESLFTFSLKSTKPYVAQRLARAFRRISAWTPGRKRGSKLCSEPHPPHSVGPAPGSRPAAGRAEGENSMEALR